MKLLYIAPLDNIHTQRWISFFSNRGHEIQIIDSAQTALKEFCGLPVHHIPWNEHSHLSSVPRFLLHIAQLPHFLKSFKTILHTFRPEVVHLHWITGPYAYAISSTINCPLMATPWGSDILIIAKKSWPHLLVTKRVVKKADRFCCDAHHLAAALQNYGASSETIDLIHFGTDTKRFSPEAKDENLAEELGFPPGTLLILSNRHLREVYDIGTLIKAIPEVVSRIPSCGFVIVGDGDQKPFLKQLVNDLGIDTYVRFVGRLSDQDMLRYTASASIYVSTSLSDGGLAASTAEAMACAVPVIITNFGENAEWTDQGKAGSLFEMKNASQLAQNLIALLADEQLRNEMGNHGRKLILERNDFYNEMSRAEIIYKQLKNTYSVVNNKGAV